jgi:hypothetical protein
MPLNNETQLLVVRGYLDLLETIDEAFSYVTSQPVINQVGAAEKMLPDILAGWTKLNETHGIFRSYFIDQPSVNHSIDLFNKLINEWETNSYIQSKSSSYELIKWFEPSYQKWKQGMEKELQKVTVH